MPAIEMARGSKRREADDMAETPDRKPGEKTSLYCPDCEEERTFVWAAWSGTEFFGYPPGQEQGWECTVCGSKVSAP
jgi:hypothetical protein